MFRDDFLHGRQQLRTCKIAIWRKRANRLDQERINFTILHVLGHPWQHCGTYVVTAQCYEFHIPPSLVVVEYLAVGLARSSKFSSRKAERETTRLHSEAEIIYEKRVAPRPCISNLLVSTDPTELVNILALELVRDIVEIRPYVHLNAVASGVKGSKQVIRVEVNDDGHAEVLNGRHRAREHLSLVGCVESCNDFSRPNRTDMAAPILRAPRLCVKNHILLEAVEEKDREVV